MLPSFDNAALLEACRAIATDILRTHLERPDVSRVDVLTARLAERAGEHVDYVVARRRDPNLVTRAVRYLGAHHAIPPLGEDVGWFVDMLEVLIELACPNTPGSRRELAFYDDLEEGLLQLRESSKGE